MKIYSYYLLEETDDFINQLENDTRFQVHYPYAFCLEQNQEQTEKDYRIRLSNGVDALLDLFLEGDDIVLDLDWQFENEINLCEEDNLFRNDFTSWLDKMRGLFDECLSYIARNCKECEKNYYMQLECMSKEY